MHEHRYTICRPRHDGNHGDGILRTSFNQLLADSQVGQGVMLLVEHAKDFVVLEENAGFFAADILLIGQFVRQRDGAKSRRTRPIPYR